MSPVSCTLSTLSSVHPLILLITTFLSIVWTVKCSAITHNISSTAQTATPHSICSDGGCDHNTNGQTSSIWTDLADFDEMTNHWFLRIIQILIGLLLVVIPISFICCSLYHRPRVCTVTFPKHKHRIIDKEKVHCSKTYQRRIRPDASLIMGLHQIDDRENELTDLIDSEMDRLESVREDDNAVECVVEQFIVSEMDC